MVAINGKEGSLEEVLSRYSGKDTFIDIDVPREDFLEIKEYDRRAYKKAYNMSITLYNKENGIDTISITDCNKLPNELKRFLETQRLITIGMTFDIKLLLCYGVKINIVHDIRCMLHLELKDTKKDLRYMTLNEIKTELEEKDEGLRLGDLSTVVFVELLYNKYKHYTQSREYLELLNVTKLLAYSNYFGVLTDINDDKVKGHLNEKTRFMGAIKNDFISKYGLNVGNRKDVKNYIRNELKIELRTPINDRELKRLCRTHYEHKDFLGELIKLRQLEKETYYLNKKITMHSSIHSDFSIRNSVASLKDIIPRDCLDIIKTDESTHYYISIAGDFVHYKYLEMTQNNVDTTSYTDYHKYTASFLYGKEVWEITKEERRKAKYYNFSRLMVAEPRFNKYLSGETREYIESETANIPYKDSLRQFDRDSLIGLNKLILSKLYKLQVELEKIDNFSIVLSHMEFGTFWFKVSNKINPYRAMQFVCDALDTTKDIGIRLFDHFSIGNDLKEVESFEYRMVNNENVPRISYDSMIEKYKSVTKEKLRNVVAEVKKDFI